MWKFKYTFEKGMEEEMLDAEIGCLNDMLSSLFLKCDSVDVTLNGIHFGHKVSKISLKNCVEDDGTVHLVIHDEYSTYDDNGTAYKKLVPGKSATFTSTDDGIDVVSR